MSGSDSTTTKPVPAPRRGRKPNEPSAPASDTKLQNVQPLFQNTVRQFYEWMDKLGKCVCCAYQKRGNVTKVGRPLKNELFVVLEEGESFSTRAVCSPCGTTVSPGNYTAMLSKIREELNTATDNEQLLRLKRMSKSPHSKPRLGDSAL